MTSLLDYLSFFKEENNYPKRHFKNFLKFMDHLQNFNYSTIDQYWIDLTKDFLDLITDLNRCAISGSELLFSQLNLDIEASDLDIFMIDTPENEKIIKEFFTENNPVLKHVFSNSLSSATKNTDKTILYAGPISSFAYDVGAFVQGDFLLHTNRIISDYFELNIIFVKRTRDTFTSDDIVSWRIKAFDDMDHNVPSKEIDKQFLILRYIWTTFDFQELKYVYDFEMKEIVSVIKYTYNLELKYLDKLEDIYKYNSKTLQSSLNAFNSFNRYKELVDKTLKKSYLEFQDQYAPKPDKILTISANNQWSNIYAVKKYIDAGRLFYYLKDNKEIELNFSKLLEFGSTKNKSNILTIPVTHQKGLTLYYSLINRIGKYVERGFTIHDPGQFLIHMEILSAAYTYSILTNKDIDKINRYSFLNYRDRTIPYLFKLIIKLRDGFKSVIDNIKVTTLRW